MWRRRIPSFVLFVVFAFESCETWFVVLKLQAKCDHTTITRNDNSKANHGHALPTIEGFGLDMEDISDNHVLRNLSLRHRSTYLLLDGQLAIELKFA